MQAILTEAEEIQQWTSQQVTSRYPILRWSKKPDSNTTQRIELAMQASRPCSSSLRHWISAKEVESTPLRERRITHNPLMHTNPRYCPAMLTAQSITQERTRKTSLTVSYLRFLLLIVTCKEEILHREVEALLADNLHKEITLGLIMACHLLLLVCAHKIPLVKIGHRHHSEWQLRIPFRCSVTDRLLPLTSRGMRGKVINNSCLRRGLWRIISLTLTAIIIMDLHNKLKLYRQPYYRMLQGVVIPPKWP
jgi:hypothetical protein